jgi:hypothetical protein
MPWLAAELLNISAIMFNSSILSMLLSERPSDRRAELVSAMKFDALTC